MENPEIEKAKVFTFVELIEYILHSIVTKTIVRRVTGNISAVSFDSGEEQPENISRFDTLIQIIDGKSEIVINDKSNMLDKGQCIIIPAHSRNTIRANVRFKMLSTIIKSGYEDVSV